MTLKPGDCVEYIGEDAPGLAKGATGDVVSSTTLVIEVDFNGNLRDVPPEMLKPCDADE